MANEISVTNNANLKVASILNQEIYMLMNDMVDLRLTCWAADSVEGSGSAAVKISQYLPDEIMSTPTESDSVANSALADAAATVTVARNALRYDISDLFLMTSRPSDAWLVRVANAIGRAGIRRVSDSITDLYTGFANTSGTSGNTLSLDDWYEAKGTLQLQDIEEMGWFTVLHPKQYNELEAEIRAEGGAVQYRADTSAFLEQKNMGFRGSFLNINFFTSNRIETDGTDYTGAMYARGAIALSEATGPGAVGGVINPSQFIGQAVAGAPIWVEFERNAVSGLTEAVGNYYFGTAELEDLKGVGLISVD